MLSAIRSYLEASGYQDVYIDFHPEVSDSFIALYCWEVLPASMNDNKADHKIQLRVRRPEDEYDQARQTCLALCALLDSGDQERLIPLGLPGPVIGRWNRGPTVLERQPGHNLTLYCELTLWGPM